MRYKVVAMALGLFLCPLLTYGQNHRHSLRSPSSLVSALERVSDSARDLMKTCASMLRLKPDPLVVEYQKLRSEFELFWMGKGRRPKDSVALNLQEKIYAKLKAEGARIHKVDEKLFFIEASGHSLGKIFSELNENSTFDIEIAVSVPKMLEAGSRASFEFLMERKSGHEEAVGTIWLGIEMAITGKKDDSFLHELVHLQWFTDLVLGNEYLLAPIVRLSDQASIDDEIGVTNGKRGYTKGFGFDELAAHQVQFDSCKFKKDLCAEYFKTLKVFAKRINQVANEVLKHLDREAPVAWVTDSDTPGRGVLIQLLREKNGESQVAYEVLVPSLEAQSSPRELSEFLKRYFEKIKSLVRVVDARLNHHQSGAQFLESGFIRRHAEDWEEQSEGLNLKSLLEFSSLGSFDRLPVTWDD